MGGDFTVFDARGGRRGAGRRAMIFGPGSPRSIAAVGIGAHRGDAHVGIQAHDPSVGEAGLDRAAESIPHDHPGVGRDGERRKGDS
jgi:hypothetical protein